MRNSGHTDVGVETNNAAFLEDAAQNADLYIANQDVSAQTQAYSLRSDVYSFKCCILIVAMYIIITIIKIYILHITPRRDRNKQKLNPAYRPD